MKPFLGVDLTTDKKNEQVNGNEFLVAKPSNMLVQSFERSSENAEETIEKSKLPLPVRIIQWICGASGAVVAVGIIRSLLKSDDISLQQAYQNAPGLFWFAGIALLVWVVLKFISTRKAKSVLETDESAQTFDNLESTCDAIFAELSVPKDSKDADILSFFYKVKDGEIKMTQKGMQMVHCINTVYKVFADSENLYIANIEGKYAFPLSSLKGIRTVKKHFSMPEWNKEERFNKGVYKQYKLTTDDYGHIHSKYYHIIEVDYNGELSGIYIPCYELPVFEELTGLKATQN